MNIPTALRRIPIVATVILLSACAQRDSAAPSGTQGWQAFETLQQAVVAATGRTDTEVEVVGNRNRIVILLMTAPAAGTDLAAMRAEATQIAAAVAGKSGTPTGLSAVQAISVTYIHKHGTSDEHTDDVFDYRRNAAGDFSEHIT
ncbi:MAG: hypothetical protein ABL964_11380 [Steroidobacteraceae bacterium]